MTPDRARLAARLAPLLFAVPVALGLAISLVRLIGNAHPVYGWSMSVNADAEAMYLGIWPFQDPAGGYTGNAYTPLFPALVSLLHHVHLWTGWPLVVSILSAAGTAALIAAIAYRAPEPGESRLPALGEAAGLGALALSFVFGLEHPALYEARPDHFSWFAAFAGLALVPRAARGGVGAKAVVVALLTAAFWSKQTAIIASACALGLVVLLAWSRLLAPRAAALWMGALLAVNAAILGLLTWATDGWQYRFNFEIALPRTRSWTRTLPDFLERGAPTFTFLVVAGVAAWAAAGRPLPRGVPALAVRTRELAASPRALQAIGFAAMAVLGLASAISLRRYNGGDDNNYIPALWGLGGLAALGYRRAAAAAAVAPGLACVVVAIALAATSAAPGGDWRLRAGAFIPDRDWPELPQDVRRYARTHLIWDTQLSDLNVGARRVIQPNGYHIQEALLRDRRPKTFERALLGRRFDAVYGFPDSPDFAYVPYVKWEDNYFWKLRQVIAQKYVRDPSGPIMPGGDEDTYSATGPLRPLVPRPGPDPAPWLDGCFGPFTLAGVTLNIHLGGGLWCVGPPGTLSMRGTPAPVTEVVSADPIRSVGGTLIATVAPRPGGWQLVRDGGWVLDLAVVPGNRGIELRLAPSSGARPAPLVVPRAALRRTGGALRLRFAGAARASLARGASATAIEVGLPPARGTGRFHVWTTRDSDATFDFTELRAR